jgi:Zn-dependent peptidase ImmA (M78 family)
MQNLKVAYLELKDIEHAAAELLQKFSKATGKPVVAPIPVDDLIEKFLKVKLEVTDLRKRLGVQDVLGATWFDEGVIRVDESIQDQEGRFCFTLGHEIAHWHLHRPQIEAEKIAPMLFGQKGDAVPNIVCRSSQKKAPAEVQADLFSSRLLMPERMVRDAFKDAVGAAVEIAGVNAQVIAPAILGRWKDLASAVIGKGNFSNVSNEAMRYRLTGLALVREKTAQQQLV